MSKIISTTMMTLLLAIVTTTASSLPNGTTTEAITYANGGEGSRTETTITSIGSETELIVFRDAVKGGKTYEGETVKLTADITVDNWDASTDTEFAGTFDGGGHVITLTGYTGLFETIHGSGIVKNLGIKAEISTNAIVGGIAAINSGIIQRCYVEGSIISSRSSGYSSGIAGENSSDATIEDCYTTAAIRGFTASGIAGANSGTIQRCYATGAINGIRLSGIAGASSGYVKNCIALNESIGSNARIVYRGTTLSGNYASPAIPGTWNNKGADKRDGADLTDENFIKVTTSTGAFTTWDATVWDLTTANLPTLKGFTTQPASSITRRSVMPLLVTLATANDLIKFRDAVNDGETYYEEVVTLTADIAVTDWNESIGTKENPFKGTFDGQGNVITLKGSTSLFGTIVKGRVANLGVDVDITTTETGSIGGIAKDKQGDITLCYTKGSITAANAGGIVGNNVGVIQDCYSTVSITATANAGGIAADNIFLGTIEQCYATGAIVGGKNVGGIVGTTIGTIRNCIALNESISGSSVMGRIASSAAGLSDLTNNYASPIIAGTWNNKTATGLDGADLTDANFIGTGAGRGVFAYWGAFKDNWNFGDNTNLPTLQGFKGDQPTSDITRKSVMTKPLTVGIANNEEMDTASVWGGEGYIHVSLPKAAEVIIYTFSGQRLKQLKLSTGDSRIALPEGLYIIVADNWEQKVIVR